MISGLDLEYWSGDMRWATGWRPDDFFKLSEKDQKEIVARVEKEDLSWSAASKLVQEKLGK